MSGRRHVPAAIEVVPRSPRRTPGSVLGRRRRGV